MLLPLVDLLNHRPLAKVEWKAGRDAVGLSVFENIGPGQEVDNNYGPKNNEQREIPPFLLIGVSPVYFPSLPWRCLGLLRLPPLSVLIMG